MSDGPFRSLPMTRRWKKAAEYADNAAASIEDISLAVASAMHQEWRREISAKLIEGIQELFGKPSLFGDNNFEGLRQLAIGKPIANSLLNYLNQAGSTGLPIHEILVKTVTQAVVERSARAIRQIQEHCIRESDPERSFKVVSRISQALQEIGYENLARRFLDPKAKSLPLKKTGIDDGVKL